MLVYCIFIFFHQFSKKQLYRSIEDFEYTYGSIPWRKPDIYVNRDELNSIFSTSTESSPEKYNSEIDDDKENRNLHNNSSPFVEKRFDDLYILV
jgi:hypothetical protein